MHVGHAQYGTVGPKLRNCRVMHAGRAAERDRDADTHPQMPAFPRRRTPRVLK